MTVRLYRPRDPEFAVPGGPEHSRMITASKAAAICGVSRWQSAYTCWMRMKGLADQEPPQDIFDTGQAFELALTELWRLRHPGWRISRQHVQYQNDELGFPAAATPDRVASRGSSRRLVEMKIARSWEEWGDVEREGDCPADYSLQGIFQMGVSGIHSPADLMVMGPWFGEKVYFVEWDEGIWGWARGECKQFWDSLAGNVPPDLDESVSTYQCVKAQHPDITAGLKREIPEGLAQDFRGAHAEHAVAEATLRGLKSKVLDAVGAAQYITCNGETVAARQPHPRGGVSLVLR